MAKADKEMEEYDRKVTECITDTALKFESTPGTGSVSGSRETSPSRAQRRFVNVKHLLPATLGEDCSTSEYRKFKREFDIWINAAYPDGYEGAEMWGTLNSRLDAGWQDQMLGIE